ncbi:MAG: endonuclease III [Nanoarchaeota archaeon]|nr:endonuclease III [Nanoarchaeota archaeon]MBU1027517.1 endonuclease III [Nanoarchaeota archaeon]
MKKTILPILKILSKKYPSNSRTTLNRMRLKPNPFKVLIACLLSLRARDENTEKVSKKLFAIADTPEKLIKIPTKKLEKIIYSSGHYKKKTATLKHVTGELIGKFNSKVPKTREELLSIKGIGPKTANIVLAFAYGKAVIPVDVHVHICANRFGWVKTKTAEKTEIELTKVLPKRYWKELNAILVQFGKDICDTRSPKCSICPISKYCPRINVKRSR